jgi:ABC-type uncharacterized transport system substrate-binding protein
MACVACALGYVAGGVWAEPTTTTSQRSEHRVYIVHSYTSDDVCGQPQHDGVVAALKDLGFLLGSQVKVGAFYMDTKKTYTQPAQIDARAKLAIAETRAFRPDVLVTVDDNAFKAVGLAFVGTPIQVVFTGLNGQPEDYNAKKHFMESRNRPGGNVTGVYEELHIFDAIRVHMRIFRTQGKVLILTDDTITGRAVKKQVEIELAARTPPCPWQALTILTWEQYQKTILDASNDPAVAALYPVAVSLKDASGRTHVPPEIFEWTTAHSTKPELAVNRVFVRMGLFGGASVDFERMGHQAGRMVGRILRGTPAGQIPIESASKYSLAFNLARAKQLGVTIPTDILLSTDELVRQMPKPVSSSPATMPAAKEETH